MGKVITVWGSPGSGKSMFCCILAKALTRDKRTAAHSCCRQTGRFRHSGLQHQHDQCVHSRRH